jgi:hypothetical protein
MSGRSRELPVSNSEGQETGKKQGKERARTMQLDVTRQQGGDKRARAQQSPTESGSYSTSSGDGRGSASQPVEKRRRTQRDTVASGSNSGLELLAQAAVNKKQQIERGRKLGMDNVRLERGWYGMTAAQRQEVGRSSYEQGKGIHAMTTEQRQEANKVGQEAKRKKHAVSMRNQNDMANRAVGYKPPQWATRDASGSGS